jgi:hypothetical protein
MNHPSQAGYLMLRSGKSQSGDKVGIQVLDVAKKNGFQLHFQTKSTLCSHQPTISIWLEWMIVLLRVLVSWGLAASQARDLLVSSSS